MGSHELRRVLRHGARHRHPQGAVLGRTRRGARRVTASRLATGGSAIDRSRPIRFSFDGTIVQGFAGDTIASALLAG
ncbi:hypothetical protein EN991_30935, partial [Mesorhizobium sp. M7A.F.Ca.US.005.03.2.1]